MRDEKILEYSCMPERSTIFSLLLKRSFEILDKSKELVVELFFFLGCCRESRQYVLAREYTGIVLLVLSKVTKKYFACFRSTNESRSISHNRIKVREVHEFSQAIRYEFSDRQYDCQYYVVITI